MIKKSAVFNDDNFRQIDAAFMETLESSLQPSSTNEINYIDPDNVGWVIEDFGYISDFRENSNPVFGYHTTENEWQYLDDGSYIYIVLGRPEGARIAIYADARNLFVDDENILVKIKNGKHLGTYYLHVYIMETLGTLGDDPQMRVNFFV